MTDTNQAFGVQDPSLAVGLSDINFFSSNIPFINVFNQIGSLQSDDGAWVIEFTDENGVEQRLDYSQLFRAGFLDEDGYIQTLPEGASSLLSLFNDIPAEANIGGRYVFTYEGEGEFRLFGGRIVESESTPGRIVIDIEDGLPVGIEITGVEEGNHLRDFALVREEHEAIFEAGAIFNPDFIDVIEDYRVLRFMDWLGTNNSNIRDFDDLATIDSAFFGIPANQSRETAIAGSFPDDISVQELGTLPRGFVTPVFLDDDGNPIRDPETGELVIFPDEGVPFPDGIPTGVPLEIMVALANQVGADPWFNIPHFATDEFVREFATFVRDNLDPDLNIFIEYSNEVWNPEFDQFHFARQEGLDLFAERRALGDNFGDQFGDFPNNAYYGFRSAEIVSIFHEVFAEDAGRINGVLGTQTVNSFVTQEAITGAEYFLELNAPDTRLDDIIDSVGITGYFGGNVTSDSIIGESLDNLIDISIQAFEDGQTSSQFELFNQELIQYYRDGTLFPGALPTLDGVLNFNLEDFRGWIRDHLSIISGNDILGNAVRPAYDFDLIQYEGGPHIVPVTNEPRLQLFLRQFNRSEAVAQIQIEAFELFREEGGTLANDFQAVGVQSFSNTFGTLAFLGDSNALADAIFDFNDNGVDTFGQVEPGRAGEFFQQGITSIDAATTSDTIIGTREEDFIAGGEGDDTIESGGGDDGVNGEEGDDVITSGGGHDTLIGGEGADSLLSGSGRDSIVGGIGNDTLRSGSNLDTVYGGDGDDVIIAQSGSDLLIGGEGNDFISASSGFDTVEGGDGNDSINGGFGGDDLSGDAGNDTINGGAGGDLLNGGIGNDVLIAGNGNDTVDAGTGDDAVTSGNGRDLILGGAGSDTLRSGSNLDTVEGGAGDDVIIAQSGADLLRGGDGNDFVSASSGFDTIEGGAGDDTLNGGFGNDSVSGDDDADILGGNRGNDTLAGGEGDDTLNGGFDEDILSGGLGADTFIFANGFGNDVITDFDQANESDRIDLSAVSEITSFADLVNNHLSTVDGNAVITVGDNSITLQGVDENSLAASDFLF